MINTVQFAELLKNISPEMQFKAENGAAEQADIAEQIKQDIAAHLPSIAAGSNFLNIPDTVILTEYYDIWENKYKNMTSENLSKKRDLVYFDVLTQLRAGGHLRYIKFKPQGEWR